MGDYVIQLNLIIWNRLVANLTDLTITPHHL